MDNLENGNIPRPVYSPIVLDRNNKEVVKLGFTEESLQKIEAEYLAIAVASPEDESSYELAKAGHIRLKGLTSSLEENKKAITKEYREKVNHVNAIANKIKARLEAVKTHLANQRAVKEDYEKRIKEEADRREQERLDNMTAKLAEYGASVPIFRLYDMTDDEFQGELEQARVSFEQRKEAERLEKERLAALEEENKKLQAEMREMQAKERARAREEKSMGLRMKIEQDFPTLELAWDEIYRLRTEVF